MPLIATSRALVTTLEGLEFQMTTGEYYVWVFVSMDTLQNMGDVPIIVEIEEAALLASSL